MSDDTWICMDIVGGGRYAGRVCASPTGCRLYGADGKPAGHDSPLDNLMVSAAREWGRMRRMARIPGWDGMTHEQVFDMVTHLAEVLSGFRVTRADAPPPRPERA